MPGVRAGAANAIKRQTIIQQWNKCESTASVSVSERRVRPRAATMRALETHKTGLFVDIHKVLKTGRKKRRLI